MRCVWHKSVREEVLRKIARVSQDCPRRTPMLRWVMGAREAGTATTESVRLRRFATSSGQTSPEGNSRGRAARSAAQTKLAEGERSLAERVGFEPTVEFPLHTLSKRAPSTTRTSLRSSGINSLPEGGDPLNRRL